MRPFRWPSADSSVPPVQATQALAMVLLEGPVTIDVPAFTEALRGSSGGLPLPTAVTTERGIVTATIPGGGLAIAPMPIAIPAGDIVGPLALAWHWPEARTVVPRHTAHLIVHASSLTLPALELRLLHTKVIGAILAVAGARATGVYVGHARLLRSAADYAADARAASKDTLPLLAWIGFNPVVGKEGRVSAYTTGMRELGFMELEVRRSTKPPAEVLGFLADVTDYQLTSGVRLNDGETFGFSAEDRRPIRHQRSEFLPDTTVVVLDA